MWTYILAVLALLAASPVLGMEYPCPTDPGFCYRDFGNDVCFDAGTDEGPINAEIEASGEFPDPPTPASIVCPPSVSELTSFFTNIRLATDTGSSVWFFGTEMKPTNRLQIMSGDQILIGGPLLGGSGISAMVAAGDIYLEGRVKLDIKSNPSAISLRSTSGNVTISPKVSMKVTDVTLTADVGDVVLGEKVVIDAKRDANITIMAGGIVDLTKAKFRSNIVRLFGEDVILRDKTSFRTKELMISADEDVSIERLSATAGASPGFIAPLSIRGTNVKIGVDDNGRVPRSTITYRGTQDVEIEASDTIDLDTLVLKSQTDVFIKTTGTTANLTNSKLVGIKSQPTFEVSGGAGSTCDVTRTFVKKGTLVTSCDTVAGP